MKQLATNGTTAKRVVRWQDRFLESLREHPNVTVACRAARISRQQAYRARGDDPQFAADWQEALDKSVDELEARAFQIAMEGDTNLLQFILRAHRPETYRETQKHEVGLVGGIVLIPTKTEGAE